MKSISRIGQRLVDMQLVRRARKAPVRPPNSVHLNGPERALVGDRRRVKSNLEIGLIPDRLAFLRSDSSRRQRRLVDGHRGFLSLPLSPGKSPRVTRCPAKLSPNCRTKLMLTKSCLIVFETLAKVKLLPVKATQGDVCVFYFLFFSLNFCEET